MMVLGASKEKKSMRRISPQRAFDLLYRRVAVLELRVAKLSHTLQQQPSRRKAIALDLMNFRLDERQSLASLIHAVEDSISVAASHSLTSALECLEYAESALEYKDVPSARLDLARATDQVHRARLALDTRSNLKPSPGTLFMTARLRKRADRWTTQAADGLESE